jgi:uncharacterized membrane protein
MSDISIDGLPASGAPFRIGVVLSKAFSVYGSKLGNFLLLTFVPLIPVLAITLMALAGPQGGPQAPNIALLGGVSVILTFILEIVAQATTVYGAFQQMGGRPFTITQSLNFGLRRALPVLGTALLAALFMGLAAMLLVFPGIIVFCMLYVAVPACVIERLGVIASLNRSAALTRGYRWQIFGLLLLVTVIVLIISFVIPFVVTLLAGALWGRLVSFGWLVIAGSFRAVLVSVVYHDLRVAKEGVDIDNLATVFD